MTFPALCDLLREVYVNVAEREFALPDKVQTDSRVSLLTGIHRKEVSRLRGAGAPLSDAPVALSRSSRIIARWLGGPPFSDARGNALPLPRAASGQTSFDALVSSITRDVRPRAVLDEWLDRGLVSLDPAGRVVLKRSAYLPHPGSEQQLYYFGRNLHDHLAAATANVVADEPRFFERAVHYDGLSGGVAQALEAQSRTLAMTLLQTANLQANQACDADDGGRWRWNLGVYVYTEETSSSSGPPPLSAVDASS